jgi:rfaE bifunctional protein nucleotidyltransferase chain/domain
MPPTPFQPSGAILTLAELVAQRAQWADAGLRVVLTNGCFDLLHVGHVRYLAAARALGDVLVVALNDDASVTALKGAGRPLQPLADRAAILAALRSVDAVVPFSALTAVAVAVSVRPDIYTKGGDYDDLDRRPPEADVVEAAGGTVVFLPFVAGRSTSELAQRLIRRDQ